MTGQLASFSLRNIKGTYFWNLEETQAAGWLPMIANTYTTDQPHEIHKWLGGAPAMKVWRGERVRDQLSDYELTVISDKFESTLAFDSDDWRRDKTGQPLRRVAEMGQKAGTLGQRLFSTLLVANGTAYDGIAFFSDATGVRTIDNNLTSNIVVATAPTSAEMSAAILSNISAMYAFLDETGDPLNEFATEFMLMVPPGLWQAAMAAIKDVFTSAGVSNTLLNAGVTIMPVVNPRLTVGTTFYMARTDAPIKAGIWQEEEIGGESFKTLGLDSDNAFWRDEIVFGAKRIAQAALGRPELMTKHVFT